MSESTTAPQLKQCPFCDFINVVEQAEPLCANCGLDLDRLSRPSPTPAPLSVLEPAKPTKARKRRKKDKHQASEDSSIPEWMSQRMDTSPTPALLADPVPVPVAQLPPVQPVSYQAPTAATPFMKPVPPVPQAPVTPAEDEDYLEATVYDRGLDATIIAPRPITATWELQLEDGTTFPIEGDTVVVGRRPEATDREVALALDDATRTLSRTHARLRHDSERDTWQIEDMASANGVATVDSDTGSATWLEPGGAADATEYLLLGRLKVRLMRRTPNQETP